MRLLTRKYVPSRRYIQSALSFRKGDALVVDQRAAEDYVKPGSGIVSDGVVDELDGQQS